jgi:putative Mn2+ efflux pump MntP
LHWLTLLGIALGLALDAFAVSIAAGLTLGHVTPRHVFRLAFHFGLFQWAMPVVGYLAGVGLAEYIESWDHWLAFGLLSYVGGKMLWESRQAHLPADRGDPTRGLTLVVLSVATSLDALAVGLSMAILQVAVWFPAAVAGVVAALLSAVGITWGTRLGRRWGQAAEIIGGTVLLLIGVRILVSHLVASGQIM